MDYVTVAELAEFLKITERAVNKRILNGDYEAISEINGRGRKKYKIAAVSYTHLDVYKRQMLRIYTTAPRA